MAEPDHRGVKPPIARSNGNAAGPKGNKTFLQVAGQDPSRSVEAELQKKKEKITRKSEKKGGEWEKNSSPRSNQLIVGKLPVIPDEREAESQPSNLEGR